MPARNVLYFVAGITVAVVLGYSAIRGHTPQTASQWLSPIGPAVTASALILVIFDRWLWRLPGVCNLHGTPVLHGTWHGSLASDWVDPETNKRISPDPNVFLVVRQRFWRVSVRLLTKESSSESVVASFNAHTDGVRDLVWVYMNMPRAGVRHRSEVHFGGTVLGAPRDRSAGLHGHYFTDRASKGELNLSTHYKTPIETHSQGLTLIAKRPAPKPPAAA